MADFVSPPPDQWCHTTCNRRYIVLLAQVSATVIQTSISQIKMHLDEQGGCSIKTPTLLGEVFAAGSDPLSQTGIHLDITA